MTTGLARWDAATVSAMLGAVVLGAQFVVGKAARDGLFLANFEPTALPAMIIGSSVFAIVLVVASAKVLAKASPESYIPAAFAVSAALLLGLWPFAAQLPRVASPLLYLMVSAVGPMLSSGFWLIATERFDPRSAKRRFGLIGAAGTIGGLLAGLGAAAVATAFGVGATILLLAALNAVAAWQTRSWARQSTSVLSGVEPAAVPTRSGARILLDTPYLRTLASIVLLGTIAAAFADYVFKVQVKAVFADGSALGGFLALYYAAVNLVSFAVQAFVTRPVLERLGLSAAISAPSLAFVAGGFAALVAPGFPMIVAMRASEAVLRGSLLRSAYEILYTPIAPTDKRAVKAVVDVGVDRFGDILGFGAIQLLLWAAVDGRLATLIGLAIVCSLLAVAVTHRVSRGYVTALERRLLDRAIELDVDDIGDWQTRTVAFRTVGLTQSTSTAAVGRAAGDPPFSSSAEGELRDLEALRSRNADAARRVLGREGGLSPALVPDAIRLLEWDAVAADVVRALRGVAEEHVGGLIDALIDPNRPFTVRRRLARVCSVCVSQRAADGLLLGLDDLRFEVRFQCGRSLAAIVERNPRVRLDAVRVSSIVLREVAVSLQVWESRQLIDSVPEDERSALELVAGSRAASRALEHVFTLLGLVLPSEPLRVAYRGLHSADRGLRGTALEYLESVLPPEIRDRLWPLLEGGRVQPRPG